MDIDIGEALRYAGAGSSPTAELKKKMEQIAEYLTAKLHPRYVWRVCALEKNDGIFYVDGADMILRGSSAETMLSGCSSVVLMACTIGHEFDMLLRAEQSRDMASALLMDGCGSAMTEALSDEIEREIAGKLPGKYLTDRFSPGYGDLPLELQTGIFSALDVQRRTGISLTESLLMNPCKSVTAFIGIADRPQPSRIRGCGFCRLRDNCNIRKGGQFCGS